MSSKRVEAMWDRLMHVFARAERGTLLIEVLVAVALLGTIWVAFLSALTTATSTTGVIESKVDIDNMARAQLEYTKNAAYVNGSGTAIYKPIDDPSVEASYRIDLPPGYDIVVTAAPVSGFEADTDIQLITVNITRDNATQLQMEGIKVNR